MFGVTTLNSDEWVLIMVLGLLPMAVMEFWKFVIRRSAIVNDHKGSPAHVG